jgi:signal transduction histidine kinase
LVIALLLGLPVQAQASDMSLTSVAHSNAGPVITFKQADFVFGSPGSLPIEGWESGPSSRGYGFEKMGGNAETKTLWVRMRFDRGQLGRDPLSVYTENNHERFSAYLNGVQIYTNFRPGDIRALRWYRPDLIRLPANALRPGMNDLTIEIESNYDLVSGTYSIGPTVVLERQYDWQMFWRVTGVQAANYIMLILSAAALWMWFLRRSDIELLLLALLGIAWFARNFNFMTTQAPFGVIFFKQMTYYVVYPAMASSLAFCVAFVRLPNWQRHAKILVIAGILLCLARLISVHTPLVDYLGTDGLGNILAVVCIAYTAFLLFKNWWRTREFRAVAMSGVLAAIVFSTAHDIGRLWDMRLWNGLGFYLQPYIGSLFCIALMISFGSRSALAFASIETMNVDLAVKVEQARADLALSEERRRDVEVARVLSAERERIMREVHDGIGSNLVSALTIAERQNHPEETLRTLRRALSDLKMTVDSLEPMHGDIVALVSNFRHRVEPDLAELGIKSRWDANDCQPLLWLDASNALHILRSLQEAMANVMLHSKATIVDIGCRELRDAERQGALVWLQDNGCGADNIQSRAGQGLKSIYARMEAIGGACEIESEKGVGTKVTLFLPYDRTQSTGIVPILSFARKI